MTFRGNLSQNQEKNINILQYLNLWGLTLQRALQNLLLLNPGLRKPIKGVTNSRLLKLSHGVCYPPTQTQMATVVPVNQLIPSPKSPFNLLFNLFLQNSGSIKMCSFSKMN